MHDHEYMGTLPALFLSDNPPGLMIAPALPPLPICRPIRYDRSYRRRRRCTMAIRTLCPTSPPQTLEENDGFT